MKLYRNNIEFFTNALYPDNDKNVESINAFNIYSQPNFNKYLKLIGADEAGGITDKELAPILKIKERIELLQKDAAGYDRDRLEFDLAIIFHSALKEANWGRYLLDDYNMWRWMSMNYFVREVFWRRGEDKIKKGMVLESARSTFDHCVGKRNRDIFPRRYFLIGERLFDKNKGYSLLETLAQYSRENKTGGFGNLILNLIDTKLLSPNDHVSKTISELLFVSGKLADDKEVVRAFTRYNGFKNRLLNSASPEIFRTEICL